MCSFRRIEKFPQSGWGSWGAELRASVSRIIYTQSSCTVQCTVYRVQHSVDSTQCTVHSVVNTLYPVRYDTYYDTHYDITVSY